MICPKCGGDVQVGTCKICEMLESGIPPGGTCTGWPMESMRMAVHPSQVAEANGHLAAHGISSREAYHKKNGKLVLESAAARKKVLKSKGMIDLEDANTKH